MEKEFNLREELAKLEHEQWSKWSHHVVSHNKVPKELIDKWVKNWKSYYKLDEKTKDSDRIWADKVLALFEQWKKEFIKRDWQLFTLHVSGKITLDELIIRRKKLAGKKLI